MSGRQWAYLLSTIVVAGLGVFIAADLEQLAWDALLAPRYVLGSLMAMAVGVANYFRPNPK